LLMRPSSCNKVKIWQSIPSSIMNILSHPLANVNDYSVFI
jgi:hypothetical protein